MSNSGKLLKVESVAYELKELNFVYTGARQATILDERRRLTFISSVFDAVLQETNNCRLDLERILYGDEADEEIIEKEVAG